MAFNRKSMKIGGLFLFLAGLALLFFQNCQQPASTTKYVPMSSTSSSSESDDDNSSNNSSSTGGSNTGGSNTGMPGSGSTPGGGIPPTTPPTTTPPTTGSGGGSTPIPTYYYYAPIMMDHVCSDTSSEKKALINVYMRLLNRCADKAGLDFWYNAQVRNNSSILASLEAGIKASDEYKNRNLAANSTSNRFCLPGDKYRVLANGVEISGAQFDAIQNSDTTIYSVICVTTNSANVAASASKIVRTNFSTAADQNGGYICSVPGDPLKNHIINMFIIYLDRCPEAAGLNWWAQNWTTDTNFANGGDVVKYGNCRFQDGTPSSAPKASIDACYQQAFNFTMCPSGSTFVKHRFCERMGY
jgi:hypothetical protein